MCLVDIENKEDIIKLSYNISYYSLLLMVGVILFILAIESIIY